MSIAIGTVLFSDDFDTGTQVDPARWAYVLYARDNNPSFFGATQTRQNLPSISNGAAHLTIDTYNPTGPGDSFVGTDIYTLRMFQPGPSGIVFTVVARLDQPQAGLVGGIFPYLLLDPATTNHNEIDTELVSNDLTRLSLNNYANQPLGPGNPQTVPLPAGASLTGQHTYQMVWTANHISWVVDGTQVGETIGDIPTGPMPLYLDFWVPKGGPMGWDYAYNPALLPASTAEANTTYAFDVSSVEVAQLQATGLIGTLTADQQLELIYVAYFNRAADGPGFNFWEAQNVQAQNAGQSASVALTNIANSFTPQAETVALYPFLGTPDLDLNAPAEQAGLATFVNSLYRNMFGHTPDTAGLNYWVAQVTNRTVGLGAAALAIANGAMGADAIELQNKIAVALDFTTRTAAAGLGGISPLPASFLTAAVAVLSGVDGVSLADASVTAGKNATTTYIAGATTSHQLAAEAPASVDPAIITVTGSHQLTDPGGGSQAIQFLPGANDDTVVPRAGGMDLVSGFDPTTDALGPRSLLAAANADLGGDISVLSNVLTISDRGVDALADFDPTGHGGSTVSRGLGSTVPCLDTLLADSAIRLT